MVTIEEFVKSKENNIFSYEFMSLYEKLDDNNISVISYNMINDYFREINDLAVTVTLSDSEMIKYKYYPEKLCADVYGYSRLYFMILAINNMTSPKDFTKKKIKMLKQTTMNDLITHLYNAEKTTKDLNEEKIR